jgi:hypothetical protein
VPSIHPFVEVIMPIEKGRKFSTGTSVHRRRKMSTLVEKEGAFGPALTVSLLPHVELSTPARRHSLRMRLAVG